MSSREDVRKQSKHWMKFCTHMREAIIDEQKAPLDYEKLIEEADRIGIGDMVREVVDGIISDEKRHKGLLLPIFDRVCPRMAVHRKGVEEGSYEGKIRPSTKRIIERHRRIMRHRKHG